MRLVRNIACLFCSVLVSLSLFDSRAAVLSQEERFETIDKTKSFLNREVRIVDIATLNQIANPFTPGIILNSVEEEVEEAPESAEELLAILAPKVKPTGIFSLGGYFIMIIKEERLRIGSLVTVNYGEKDYELTVTSIQRNSYTLKFRDAEMEIKLN